MNANQSTSETQTIAPNRSANFNPHVKWLVIVLVALLAFEWKQSRGLPPHDPVSPQTAEAASVDRITPSSKVATTRIDSEVTTRSNRTAMRKPSHEVSLLVPHPLSQSSRPPGESPSEPTIRLPKPPSKLPAKSPVQTVSLPYATPLKSQTQSREMLAQAMREYQVGASLSAETSAWMSLVDAAEAIAIASNDRPPMLGHSTLDPRTELQLARTALLEARDFADQASANHQVSLVVIVKSHQTKTLHTANLSRLSATQAIEIYLDEARNRLASLASQNRMAAEAMDLLAAIYLTRNDPATMPTSTSLCLRRAALAGQPGNASLASSLGFQLAKVGLLDESQRVLAHSLKLRYDLDTQMALVHVLRAKGQPQQAAQLEQAYWEASRQAIASADRKPIPEIEQLSPAEFAAVSRPVMPATRLASNRMSPTQAVPISFASQRMNSASQQPSVEISGNQDGNVQADKPSILRNPFESMTKWW